MNRRLLMVPFLAFTFLTLSWATQPDSTPKKDEIIRKANKRCKKIEAVTNWTSIEEIHLPAQHYTLDDFESEFYFQGETLKKIIVKCFNTNLLYFRTFYVWKEQLICVRERSFIYEKLIYDQDKPNIEVTREYARNLPNIKHEYRNDYYFQGDTLYQHTSNEPDDSPDEITEAERNYSQRQANGVLKEFKELVEKVEKKRN